MAAPDVSPVPDQPIGSMNPQDWADAFWAENLVTPDILGPDRARLTEWFGAALATGQHYGAKVARGVEVPELTVDQMRAIELEHLEYTDKNGGIMSQALRARLWTLRAEQHG